MGGAIPQIDIFAGEMVAGDTKAGKPGGVKIQIGFGETTETDTLFKVQRDV